MEHPLLVVTIEYRLTHDLQLIEHSQPLKKQILMPDGLKIQGRNLLLHLIGAECKTKEHAIYRHAYATRISKLAMEKIDQLQQLDVKTLNNSSFVIVHPETSVPTQETEARAYPNPILQQSCPPAGPTSEKSVSAESVVVCTRKEPERNTSPKYVEHKATEKIEEYSRDLMEEHLSVPQFLSLLYMTADSSLDPHLHCATRGRCSSCRNESSYIIITGCRCSFCIYCALGRASVDEVACRCGRKDILPFSQWTGLSTDMKQSIRRFAKQNQTDPYVHSPYNDFVDILNH